MRTIARGLAAGALATIPMSAFMYAAKKAGFMGEQPPEKITNRLLKRTGVRRPSRRAQDVAASALHLGFGAGAGAVFALLLRLVPQRIPRWIEGTVFATGIWAVSYQGWVPGLGIMPPADRDRPGRPESMIAAHWIYGAALGWLLSGPRAYPFGGRAIAGGGDETKLTA